MQTFRNRLLTVFVAFVTCTLALMCMPLQALAQGALTIVPSDGVSRDYSAWRVLAGNVRGGVF